MIILASASPRRKELLEKNNVSFCCIPSSYEEKLDEKKSPMENVKALAHGKAMDVFSTHPDDFVIGSDTIVVLDDIILGKPIDENDAFRMLKMLQGKMHMVMTGVCFASKKEIKTVCSVSNVYFNKMTDEEINEYIDTKEPFGKAGSYAIQGIGKRYINHIEGDYYTIVGLPIDLVLEEIKNYN